MDPKFLNIVTPGTFGVFSTKKASSPYLQSSSFGNCIGLILRGPNFAVLAHLFAGSHKKFDLSIQNIQTTLQTHFLADINQVIAVLYFKGGSANDTSEVMCKTISKFKFGSVLAKAASQTYQDMLFNAITGELSVYSGMLLSELKKRLLLNAAASNVENSESPIEWNYFVNWRSEPEGEIEISESIGKWKPNIFEMESGGKKGSKANPYI